MAVVSVPFEVETTGMAGSGVLITRAHGVLRLEPTELVLEFVLHNSDLSEFTGVKVIIDTGGRSTASGGESDLRTVRIPLDALVDLKLKGRWLLTPKLHLEVNRVGLLADVPWAHGARCAFTVRRADRERARSLAVDMQLRLADARLRELEGST